LWSSVVKQLIGQNKKIIKMSVQGCAGIFILLLFFLQDMFPSQQRATLISIESFSFSLVMMVLSPLAGFFFSYW